METKEVSHFRVMKSPREVDCDICGGTIEEDDVRLTANLGSGHYARHYHPLCFYLKYKKEIQLIVLAGTLETNELDLEVT